MDIDSIIFDLDGTLWNAVDVTLKAWQSTLAGRTDIQKPITKEDLEALMGLQIKEFAAKLFPYLSTELQMKVAKDCSGGECDWIKREGGVLYPKLKETLKSLSEKLPLFIVSNCNYGYIDVFLEYHDLKSYFVDFEYAGNKGLLKGENIKKLMERNNLKHPIYVGDTEGDFDGAKLANIPFVFASYGFGKVKKYDYIIKEISDLVKLVAVEKSNKVCFIA